MRVPAGGSVPSSRAIVTAPVSTMAPVSSRTNPMRWPATGLDFHGMSGTNASPGKTGTGLARVSSYSVRPLIDRPVVSADANSAKLRTGVGPGVGDGDGIVNGLLVTATLDVAME